MTIKDNQLEVPFTAADRTKLDGVTAGAEVNPAFASQVVAEAGVDNAQIMTALRVKQAIDVFASSAGESNTASNLGAGDGEVFSGKSVVDLQFRSLVAGTNITISQDSDEITINSTGGGGAVDSVNTQTGAVVLDADDIDETASRIWFTTAEETKLSGITAGAEPNPDTVSQVEAETGTATVDRLWTAQRVNQAIQALAPGAGGGETNTASNLGAGEGIFSTKVASDLQFKSLVAGTNVSFSSDSDEITINATGGSSLLAEEFSFELSASGTIAGRTPSGLPAGWSVVNGNNGSVDGELDGSDDDLVIIHNESKTAVEITVIRIDGSTPFGGSGRFKIDSSGAANERVKTNSSETQSRFKNFQLDVGNFAALVYVRLL